MNIVVGHDAGGNGRDMIKVQADHTSGLQESRHFLEQKGFINPSILFLLCSSAFDINWSPGSNHGFLAWKLLLLPSFR